MPGVLKSLAVAEVAAGIIFAAQAADSVHHVSGVTAGGTYDLAPTDAQNVYATASAHSQLIFAGDGTLRLTGGGAMAEVKTTLVATNGTLTVDASDFEFSGSDHPLLLGGGIDCGTAGKLKVVGATQVTIGDTRSTSPLNMPVRLPEVELPVGATLSFAKIGAWTMPDRTRVPWTIDDKANQWFWGDNVLTGLTNETGTVCWTNVSTVNICNGSPVGSGTLDAGTKQVEVYPTYNPAAMVGEYKITQYLVRHGQKMTCDTSVRAGTVYFGLRDVTWNGGIESANLYLRGAASSSNKAALTFNGPVSVSNSVFVESRDNKAGQLDTFAGVAFTNGQANLTITATNAVVKFTKAAGPDYEPAFKNVSFTNEQARYAWHSAIEVGAGLTVRLGSVTAGTGILRGSGTVKLGGIVGTGKLLVEPGLTVVKDETLPGTFCVRTDDVRIEGQTYTTYFAANGADGSLDLSTYEGAGVVSVSSGMKVYGSTNAAPSQVTVKVDGTDVKLRAYGDTWRDDARITHWFDFSDVTKITQVVATDPTLNQSSTKVLAQEDLGPKSVSLNLVGTKWTDYPALERVDDCRGGSFADNTLYNGRMYQQQPKTNEWWASVYMVSVTNDAAPGRTYASAGKGGDGRRLFFVPAVSKPKSITLVFGSQFGGGAGLFADSLGVSGRVFGRNRTLDDPILTNDTCDVWVDGVKVDPTKAKFSGGWQVITVQPKPDYMNLTINGIGYSTAYTGKVADVGGQNYGEIVIYNALPTEEERVQLEQHLADKWGIAYGAAVTNRLNLTGTGSASVSGTYEIGGDFAGRLALTNDACVTFTGTTSNATVSGAGELTVAARAAMPRFADDFAGVVRTGPDFAWSFAVNPTAGTVADAINLGAGRLILPTGTVPVTFDVTGNLDAANKLTLVTAGALEGAPTWEATVVPSTLPLKKATFDQTATSLAVTLGPKRGVVLVVR